MSSDEPRSWAGFHAALSGVFSQTFDGLALSSETGVEPGSDGEEESVLVLDWIFNEVAGQG